MQRDGGDSGVAVERPPVLVISSHLFVFAPVSAPLVVSLGVRVCIGLS